MKLKIYTDGACRGNPGPSAIAFLILDNESGLVKEYSEYIGNGTNNQAEYKALISALKFAIGKGTELECYLDSELVVKQMNGEYRVKNPTIRTLWRNVVALKEKFQKVIFIHVPRTNEYIKKVDQLANLELDKIHNPISNKQPEGKEEKQEVLQLSKKVSENITKTSFIKRKNIKSYRKNCKIFVKSAENMTIDPNIVKDLIQYVPDKLLPIALVLDNLL